MVYRLVLRRDVRRDKKYEPSYVVLPESDGTNRAADAVPAGGCAVRGDQCRADLRAAVLHESAEYALRHVHEYMPEAYRPIGCTDQNWRQLLAKSVCVFRVLYHRFAMQ